MKNPNALLIGGGVIAVAAIIYFLKNKEESTIVEAPVLLPTDPLPTPTNPKTSQPNVFVTPINESLILKKGSKGREVAELQKLLKFQGKQIDGNFGNATEDTLYTTKGVKEISLVGFKKTPSIVTNLLKVGDKVMAYSKPVTKVFENLMLADKSFSNTGKQADTYNYGTEIGSIVQINYDKTYYIVRESGMFSNTIVWVKANEVKKI